MRSDIIERTVDVCDQNVMLALLLFEIRLTALCKDDGFDLMIRQTRSIDADIPVRSERSADSEEQEDAHCSEKSNARYYNVHPSNHLLGVDYAEKE